MTNTGRAVNALPWAFAVRYVVIAISDTSNSSVRHHPAKRGDDRADLDVLEPVPGTVTLPSFSPFVCAYVATAVLSSPPSPVGRRHRAICSGGGASGATRARSSLVASSQSASRGRMTPPER